MFSTRGKRTMFYCFSPPVMVLTFIIEIALAAYTLWRYRRNTLTWLVVTTLCFLALFQLSEYFVCGGIGVDAMQWSRIGYAAITVLPPLGMHMLYNLAERRRTAMVAVAYATGAAFVGYFLLHEQAFSGHVCGGNYVIFQLTPLATQLYALYYYGWLLAAITLGFIWRSQPKKKIRRKAIGSLIAGYAVFLVPTSIAVVLDPEVLSGIPSVMCGFAVLFAFILVFYLLPVMRTAKR